MNKCHTVLVVRNPINFPPFVQRGKRSGIGKYLMTLKGFKSDKREEIFGRYTGGKVIKIESVTVLTIQSH